VVVVAIIASPENQTDTYRRLFSKGRGREKEQGATRGRRLVAATPFLSSLILRERGCCHPCICFTG